ncbi:MAG: hypothetical protein LBU89_11715 [Fibromonadaceae bacterium]|nr:hypothetical protein [Fibromonadaceae bacterium]
MQFLSVREFSKSPQATLASLSKNGKAVLTNNGKPTALILYTDEFTFEDTLLDLRKLKAKRDLFDLQMQSIENGTSEITMDEINEEVKCNSKQQ